MPYCKMQIEWICNRILSQQKNVWCDNFFCDQTNVRSKLLLLGHLPNLVGHCPMSDSNLQPCYLLLYTRKNEHLVPSWYRQAWTRLCPCTLRTSCQQCCYRIVTTEQFCRNIVDNLFFNRVQHNLVQDINWEQVFRFYVYRQVRYSHLSHSVIVQLFF
jgi:hypothetical protein